jgi:hypothetical protein
MPNATTEQINWLKTVLGLDLAATRGEQHEGEDEAKGPETLDEDQVKGGLFEFFKQKVGETVGTRPPLPKDKDLAAALEALDDKIEAVGKLGLDTKQLEADRWDSAWAGDKAEKLTDKAEHDKALTRVKDRLADLLKHATALADSAKSVMGTSKDNPTSDQKSAIYKKALEDHYGITIENPDNMANTHLDRVFDMFGTVPVGDAKQDKLKILRYMKDRPGDKWSGSGAYNKTELAVKMGDFGDASGMENYEIDGEVLPANSFDVTTLHEIGHAVDFNHSIMSNNGAKAACGGWQSETVDSIAAVYLTELKKTPGLSTTVDEGALSTAIKAALSAGTTAKPDPIVQADWEKVVAFLTTKCLPIRSANSPWFKSTQVIVGDRVYQQAYSTTWVSYLHGARASTKVNNYQWRAPGEWFAEVYAISWLKKKKPPTGVDSAVADYMWKG